MRMKVQSLVTFFVIVVVMPVWAQSPNSDGAHSIKWINLPSSPLKVEIVNEEFYGLSNYSEGRVTRYRFGCVVWEREKLKILKTGELKYTPFSLRPIDLTRTPPRTITLLEGYPGFSFERCTGNSKNAIIEVRFEDGGMWKAQQ